MRGKVVVKGALSSSSGAAAFAGAGVAPIVHAIIIGGQSNPQGPNSGGVPAGIPSSDVRYWLRVVGDASTNDNAFRDLDVRFFNDTHSLELQLGLDLHAAGLTVAIVKVTRGNTFISSWIPGAGNGNSLLSEVTDASAALATEFPGHGVHWHFIWWQGESEAKDASEDAALAWGDNYDLIKAGLEGIVGPLRSHIIRTHADLGSAPWLATVRSQQAAKADDLQSTDGYTQDGDLTHFPAATYNPIGADAAALILAAVS